MRTFYVSNAATGEYFVLEKDFPEFVRRVGAYVMNLHSSQKCPNTYTFGSAEMTESEYQRQKATAEALERGRIKGRIDDRGEPVVPKPLESAVEKMNDGDEEGAMEEANNVVNLFKK